MFCVENDKACKLLTITYSQHVGVLEMPFCVNQIKNSVAHMESGFRLLVDFSGMESMDVACAVHLAQIMDVCSKKGVDSVFRIIPDSHKDIGLNILSLFHYGPNVTIIHYENREEAMRDLTA
jgi:hypothetical protein